MVVPEPSTTLTSPFAPATKKCSNHLESICTPEPIPSHMEQIFQQVGALLVGSIPTALLFVLLVLAYQFLIQGPLTETLKKRSALTAGAIEDAQKAIAQAEERAAEYGAKLRQARADVFKIREQRVKQWNAERDAALDQARKAAQARVIQAEEMLDTEAAVAKLAIQASAGDLAAQVVRAVMPLAAGGSR